MGPRAGLAKVVPQTPVVCVGASEHSATVRSDGPHWSFDQAIAGEGAYVGTFMQAAHSYGVSPTVLMGIGMVESGGGVAGTAYMGCMNYSTFGSWPGQIYCAAQVLSRYGLAGYNAVNPSYSSTVMGEAYGIRIVQV